MPKSNRKSLVFCMEMHWAKTCIYSGTELNKKILHFANDIHNLMLKAAETIRPFQVSRESTRSGGNGCTADIAIF